MSLAMSRLLSIVIAVALLKSIECSTAKSAVGSFDAFQTIEAEDFNFSNFSTNCQDCNETTVYMCFNNIVSTVGYYKVDFAKGAVKVNYRVASWVSGGESGTFNFHLDDAQSLPFATIDATYTGGVCSWVINSSFLGTIATGVHDLYLTFTAVNRFNNMLVDIDWFSFDATSGNQTIFDAFSVIEAEDFNYTQVAVAELCPGSSVSYVGSLKAGTVIAYYGVNFGSGAQMIQIRLSSWDQGTLYLRLDSALNEPFITIPIQKAGPDVDSCNFFILEEFASTVPTGVHDLYFTLDLPTGVVDFVNIDWLSFKFTAL